MVPIPSMIPWVLGPILDLYLLQVRTNDIITVKHMVFWVGKCRWMRCDAWLPFNTHASNWYVKKMGVNSSSGEYWCFCWFLHFQTHVFRQAGVLYNMCSGAHWSKPKKIGSKNNLLWSSFFCSSHVRTNRKIKRDKVWKY